MTLAFRPSSRAQPRVDHVGVEGSPVIVIDNFADDPQALVDFAASLAPFPPAARTYYPGATAPVPMTYALGVHAFLHDAVCKTFALGEAVVAGGGCDFSLVTTRPEDLHLRQLVPHIDSTETGFIAFLHYLCPSDLGGTSLYRHRRTGFEVITANRVETYERAIAEDLDAAGRPDACINGDTALFERIASYEAVFNRMLIYRGASLHSGNIGADFPFDPHPRTGRLTLNLFLQFRPR